MTGTITDLRRGGRPGGFGFIASDAHGRPRALPFHRRFVDDDGFDALHVGQRVRFDQVPLPGDTSRFHAVRVSPLVPTTGTR